MPSSRAILHDLAASGADPARSYNKVSTDGSLRFDRPEASASPILPPCGDDRSGRVVEPELEVESAPEKTIHIDLTVTMKADEVEKVIIKKPQPQPQPEKEASGGRFKKKIQAVVSGSALSQLA